jgi:hypothetical protein
MEITGVTCRARTASTNSNSWHALFGVAEFRVREGRGGRLEIPYNETGISADFIEANSQVVRIHVTERKGVAGPRVAHRHGNLEG